MPLTDLKIKNLKAKDKAYRAYDSEGLYIQVSPSGGKLWRWLGHRDSALRLFQDLLHRHGFGQISRLIHVCSFGDGGMIGQELDGQRV